MVCSWRAIARTTVAACILGATTAQAALVSLPAQTRSFDFSIPATTWTRISDPVNGGPDSIDQGIGSAQKVLSFDQFDVSLGTLVGVTFGLNSRMSRSLNLSVNGFEGSNYLNIAKATFIGELLGGGFLADSSFSSPLTTSCAIRFSTTPGGCSATSTGSNVFGSPTMPGLAPLIGNFAGTGTFDLTAKLSADITELTAPDNGTSVATVNSRWVGDMSLVYTYETRPAEPPTPSGVPEPLSLSLVGVALAGLALTRRRRT